MQLSDDEVVEDPEQYASNVLSDEESFDDVVLEGEFDPSDITREINDLADQIEYLVDNITDR